MATPKRFTSSFAPARPLPSLTIQLTEQEDQLCTLLDECSKSIHEAKPESPPVECRIAGGWVRDKLLGLHSNDIDVALSSMMGVPFAEHLVEFLTSKGHTMREAHKIARNPEQSKHLETAVVNVLGTDIDLVNLRSEIYAEGSRIPSEVAFGTPLEDALRRDITINSLFYNIHTRSVEDFTENGLDDLKTGIIRTPLAPRETFMDDPLRVLRCIRFASRYGFEIEDGVWAAIKDPEIQAAVRSKISRERVGVELDKMLKAKHPLLSLRMIDALGLHASVFWLPQASMETLSQQPAPRSLGLAAASILERILSQTLTDSSESSETVPALALPPIHRLLLTHAAEPDVQRRLYLAAALTPFKGITLPEKKRVAPATEIVIREGLKLGTQNHYMDGIPALYDAHSRLTHPTLDRFGPSEGITTGRAAIGLALREKTVHNPFTGSHWSTSLLFSLLQDLMEVWDAERQQLDESKTIAIIDTYNTFVSKVEELGVPAAIDEKPLLDGKRVFEVLNERPGPHMTAILARVTEWQLSHPGEGVASCEAYLKEEKAAGRLPAAPGPADGKRGAKQDGKANKKAKIAKAE